MSPPPHWGATSSDQSGECTFRRRVEEGISHAFARLLTDVYRLSGDWSDWHPALSRVSAHTAILIIALTGIALSSVEWSAQTASGSPGPAPRPTVEGEGPSEETESPIQTSVQDLSVQDLRVSSIAGGTTDAIFRQAQPHTIIPERPRLEIVTYTVEAGDTVQSIADQFGLDPTSILWANPPIEDAPDLLRIGQEVVILPIDGVLHKVDRGDTLASIAELYDVEPGAIASCEYNDLGDANGRVELGEFLIVPGGEKPYEPKVVTAYTGPVPEGARGTGRFQWPVLGSITQDYWYGHRAIDIGAPTGSAVLATDGGFVSFAGWTDVGYGYLIVVDHANGFATYYAHLSNIYVTEGQAVERGRVIGAAGNTGNSTGPHLHFEVRRNGVQQNPRAYLP
jgi:murein DD-endopeptidase MepM/ murein hydrolase activator NlpD